MRNHLGVGELTVEDRMIVYHITYILMPRSSNHTQVNDDDLQIVYGLKFGIQMNWVQRIEDIMLKCRRLVDYEFPYAMITSRFIDYFQVDVSNEIVDNTKASCEITERHLKKLGMRYANHEWIIPREPTARNIDEMEEDDGAGAQHELAPQWSPFESLMIQKMDAMLHLHQEHLVKVHISLENINTRLKNRETKLSLRNLPKLNKDDA